jgi:hypothetical protein
MEDSDLSRDAPKANWWEEDPPEHFKVGERVGKKGKQGPDPCYGRVASVGDGCCGAYKVGVDWLCHDHPGVTRHWERELEHID